MIALPATPTCAFGCPHLAVVLVENVPACAEHYRFSVADFLDKAEPGEIVSVLKLAS